MNVSHLTRWPDVDNATWNTLVERSITHYRRRTWTKIAAGKSLGMLFFNPSIRTRTSMELAAVQLGAHPTVLTPGTSSWDLEWRNNVVMNGPAAEHIREAVGVLSEYFDALGVRVFASMTDYRQDADEQVLRAIQQASSVPVINLESAFHHPCQALADAAALRAHHRSGGNGKRFVLAWATHPKALPMAVPNSALYMAAREGFDVTIACPPEYALDDGVMASARHLADISDGSIQETDALDAACEDAHVIYAKAWGGSLAYSDPIAEAELRTGRYADWRITQNHMQSTADGCFMHCLPVRRGVVVDDAVLDGPDTIHLLQAAFRLHAAKSVLEWIWDLPTSPTESHASAIPSPNYHSQGWRSAH